MRTVEITPKIIVKFPQSEDLCKKRDTNPRNMYKLYSAYKTYFARLIDHFSLNEVNFTFNIDNWRGAGIDTNFKLKLYWKTEPRGNVAIYLGFPEEINILIQEEIIHTLSHEMVHVLIFSYLTTLLNCPPLWINKGYFLPDECKVPKKYIELLCDTLGLTSQFKKIDKFLRKWNVEWDPKKKDEYGEYYYHKNHLWAIEFIEKHSKNVHNILSKKKVDNSRQWKSILDRYFKSEDSTKWMVDILKLQ